MLRNGRGSKGAPERIRRRDAPVAVGKPLAGPGPLTREPARAALLPVHPLRQTAMRAEYDSQADALSIQLLDESWDEVPK
jgi:hypothetical protein